MIPFGIGLIASFVLVLVATLQYGDVADRKWRAIAWEPVIAFSAIVGIGEAIKSASGCVGYVIGSTLAAWLAMYIRRRQK